MSLAVDARTDALIVVDVQNDFCPGGALPVPQGDQVVPAINRVLNLTAWLTVATRDWHPQDHCSFKPQGGIWPVHCVAGTRGAAFHPGLDAMKIRQIISKATTKGAEAYSGFQGTELTALLRGQGIQRVFVCGLATDYCVKATALDARRAGFGVLVLDDAIRGVEVQPGDCAKAIEEMAATGIGFVKTTDLTP
ncbi:MAG: nicotinamidase [Candidatus Methylomirabilota bacterium]